MYIISSYSLAVFFCIITMLCWGSWGNTQKLAAKTWRYELFYWDYVIGIVLLSIVFGFTLGSIGEQGRSFTTDLAQVSSDNLWSAILGGVIFNASNILLSASISIAGMAVAFPVGVGLALVLGVILNYNSASKDDPVILFTGVALIVVAIVFNGIASGKMAAGEKKSSSKGIWLAVIAGTLMSFFYRFVAAAMDVNNFESPTPGMMTPYTAFFVFAMGMLVSNFLFNTVIMRKPFVGSPVSYKDYFSGSFSTHLVGVAGGLIWGLGTVLSYMSAGKAGAAISYALGQGATMVAAFWGVFIWKEFKGAGTRVNVLLFFMFLLFISGLALIIVSGGN
ncbi:MAG TPA: GRP family sugar transporter [Cyclobacteriaceae bacterium]|nr:GRP family sugar transporter [Cyclobacteriaceae bacterium]HMV09941.1 GRP family sugar transporter [Cyclobacteriaceae bacterium]HMV90696.1 GRP family sugar transporter [Cyclobacteriaceae bacterium]HMX01620.1 GRP family sugar transporter [Cyclobacteriaceae bacterium]HMX50686.1 GRP family sugar transporter [Cyclobacteriaceae bacterium]